MRPRHIAAAVVLVFGPVSCQDNPTEPPDPLVVTLSVPSSVQGTLQDGEWGCSYQIIAEAVGGRSGASAEWISATLYGTRSGDSQASSLFTTAEGLGEWFGSPSIATGQSLTAQRRVTWDRSFDVRHVFEYRADGEIKQAEYTLACNFTPPEPGGDEVASVTISPDPAGVEVGNTVQLSATARDADGNALSGVSFSWSSSAPSIARVDASGRVTGLAEGSATITATAGGESGSVQVSVTAAAPTATTITIDNKLIFSVNITVNGNPLGSVPAQSVASETVTESSITVGWSLVRPTVGGRALGDPMSGTFQVVDDPPAQLNYTVDNIVGDTWYFAPLMTNNSSQDWLMGVNMGLASENRCNCGVPAGATNIHLGYYRFFTNSNVRAYLSGSGYTGSYLYWTNITVQQGSGVAYLTN